MFLSSSANRMMQEKQNQSISKPNFQKYAKSIINEIAYT